MTSPLRLAASTALALVLVPVAVLAASEPTVNSIDYSNPNAYSFNSDYDNLLPLTRGHVLLIETQRGVPTVPLDVLERVHPGAAKGLKANDGVVRIGKTTIAFVDCSESDGGKPPQLPLFAP